MAINRISLADSLFIYFLAFRHFYMCSGGRLNVAGNCLTQVSWCLCRRGSSRWSVKEDGRMSLLLI